MNWTTIGTVLAICGTFGGVILAVAKIIANSKYRKRLPECEKTFEKIRTDMEEMKKGSTDRQSMVIALEAAMKIAVDQYKELIQDYKSILRESNTICVELGKLNQNFINLKEIVEEIKDNN